MCTSCNDSSRQPVDKSSIPEGFFDDPLQDAKARKVEYKDPMMDEWEKFQKTIKKEDDVSMCRSCDLCRYSLNVGCDLYRYLKPYSLKKTKKLMKREN